MAKYEEAHKEHINKYKMAHMIGVAEYMRERALDYGIDPNVAYAVGLMHDIGYLEGRHEHEQSGAEIMLALGIEEDSEVYNAIRYHGTNPYILSPDVISSPLLILTYEADLSVDARGYRVGFDKRLKDIDTRLAGTEFHDEAVYTSTQTVAFVKEWQARNYIPSPPKGFFNKMQKNNFEK